MGYSQHGHRGGPGQLSLECTFYHYVIWMLHMMLGELMFAMLGFNFALVKFFSVSFLPFGMVYLSHAITC